MVTVMVAVRDDERGEPQTIAVGAALAEAIQCAAIVGSKDHHPLSFASLLLGMATGSDAVAEWLDVQLSRGADLNWLLRRVRSIHDDLTALRAFLQTQRPAADAPLRSTAAKTAMDKAQAIAAELSAVVDARHLLAAYLVLPHYHDVDFQQLHVDRHAWAESFAQLMMHAYPGEDAFWSSFPNVVKESQQGSPQQGAAPLPDPRAPADQLDLNRDETMESHVSTALKMAFALADKDQVTPSHVLRAVLIAISASPDHPSPAFQHLAHLVPLPDPGQAPQAFSSLDSGRLDEALRRHLELAWRPLDGEHESTQLWGRDLVTAALLCSRDAAALIEEAGKTIEDVRDHWYAYVVSDEFHRTPDQWRAWWRHAGVPLPGDPVRAGLATETDVGDDKLGISGEARAFARLILDRKVEAPLSIGLLGDWGSGKSFFIEQVKNQIKLLRGETHPDLYQNPIEIEFNAWHASDSNLWASLVTHIFDEIWQKVSPTGTDDPEAARHRLLKEIEEAKGAVHEAEAQVEYGRIALAKAERDLARKQADLAWDKVVKTEAKEKLREIADAAGWHEPLATINAVDAAARTLAASSNRLRRAIGSLLERPFRRVALPTIALAAAAAGLWLALHDRPSLLAQVAKWLGSIASTIGALTAPLALANHKVSRLADQLGRIGKKYDAAVKDMPREDAERLTTSRRELDSAEASVAAAKVRLADLLGQQAALDPRRRLGAFLQERVQSTVYRSQQGIISLVYKDFEKLSRYMKDLRTEQAKGVALGEGNIRAFDRIVIYVDDLDRCRPAHVVAMLEAVHLLLALDLFIVVVAVDSRWLTRALEVHYKDLLDSDGADAMRSSTPQSYLEKIFQITYALRPMDPAYFRSYVEFLADAQATDDKPAPVSDAAVSSASPPTTPTSTAVPAPHRRAPSEPHPSQPMSKPAAPSPAGPALPPSRPVIITADEQEFIWKLRPLLPTPRIAKRLVNVYRVIKANKSIAEANTFEQDRSTPCLLMLAILFGRPIIAGELLRSLYEGTAPFHEPDTSLVEAIGKRADSVATGPEPSTGDWRQLHKTLALLHIQATVAECAREPMEIARYSLVTGHDWHTWTSHARTPPAGPSTPPRRKNHRRVSPVRSA